MFGNERRATVYGEWSGQLEGQPFGPFWYGTITKLHLTHGILKLNISKVVNYNINCIDGGGSVICLGTSVLTSYIDAVTANIQFIKTQNINTCTFIWVYHGFVEIGLE